MSVESWWLTSLAGRFHSFRRVSTLLFLLEWREGTYECNHLSRYKSMNDSKDPRFWIKTVHIDSKVAIMAAAVFSMLSVSFFPWGRSWEMDVIGGAFRMFSPQPDL